MIELVDGANFPREVELNGRVVNVFALRGYRHDQMIAYRPFHQLAIIVAHVVGSGEHFRIFSTEHAMIATTPLGDVMEKGGQIQDMWVAHSLRNQ